MDRLSSRDLLIRNFNILMPKNGKVLITLKSGAQFNGAIWLHYPKYRHILDVSKSNIGRIYDIGVFPACSRLIFALISLDKDKKHIYKGDSSIENDPLEKHQLSANKWEIKWRNTIESTREEICETAVDIEILDEPEHRSNSVNEHRQDSLDRIGERICSLNLAAARKQYSSKKLDLGAIASLSPAASSDTAYVYIDGSEVVAEDAYGQKIISGEAGKDDPAVIASLFFTHPDVILQGNFSHDESDVIQISTSNISLRGVKASFNNIRFSFNGLENALIEDLILTGRPGGSSFLVNNCNSIRVNRITIVNPLGNGCAAFSIYIPPDTVNRNHYYNDCVVMDGNKFGFLISGSVGTSQAINFNFNGCEAHRCGLSSRINEWVTGFDLSEVIVADGMIIRGCKATYCWESGFHMENRGTYKNVIFNSCVADYNGRKPVPTYGNGFLVGGGEISECSARYNRGTKYMNGSGIYLRPSTEQSICHKNFTSGNTGSGIIVSTGNKRCIITNNVSSKDLYGIHAYGPDKDCISGAIISCNEIYNPIGCGISMYNVPESIVTNNIIRGGTIGINTMGVNKTLFSNNQVLGCSKNGIYLRGLENRVIENRIDVTGTPIDVSNGSTYVIKNNSGYITEASGSSVGIGTEDSILHGMSAMPKGCKAWIKYSVGNRYITEMISFDATKIYPTVKSGVFFEWRIE